MNKIALFVASLLMSISSFAQWAKPAAPAKTTFAPRTKGYTPFEGLGDLFSQQED